MSVSVLAIVLVGTQALFIFPLSSGMKRQHVQGVVYCLLVLVRFVSVSLLVADGIHGLDQVLVVLAVGLRRSP